MKTIHLELSKSSDVVKNQVFKKILHDEWVKKANTIQNIDTSDLAKKSDYDRKKVDVKKKIPNHNKYITTSIFNELMRESVATRLRKAKLEIKDDIVNLVKKAHLNEKLIFINKKG